MAERLSPVGGAAHEVRTRLQVVRTELELAGRRGELRVELADKLRGQLDLANAAVEALLEAEASRQGRPTPLRLPRRGPSQERPDR